MSAAHQANIDWYAPQQVWEPIHARVDESSEWFEVHLDRAEDKADIWDKGSVEREHTIYGYIAEAVVLNVFPHLERFDGETSDLHGYGKVFDVCAGNIRVEPSPNYEIIVYGRKRPHVSRDLYYYAVRRNHPDYYLIGYTNSIRFWHLAHEEPGDHMAKTEFFDDGAGLTFDHFTQLPIPESFNYVVPAIDVFGQG